MSERKWIYVSTAQYDFSNINNGIVYAVGPLYSVGSTSAIQPTADGKYMGGQGGRILESP